MLGLFIYFGRGERHGVLSLDTTAALNPALVWLKAAERGAQEMLCFKQPTVIFLENHGAPVQAAKGAFDKSHGLD